MVLVPCEMQSVSSRIWTLVAVSISYDDNDYTTIQQLYDHLTSISKTVHVRRTWDSEMTAREAKTNL